MDFTWSVSLRICLGKCLQFGAIRCVFQKSCTSICVGCTFLYIFVSKICIIISFCIKRHLYFCCSITKGVERRVHKKIVRNAIFLCVAEFNTFSYKNSEKKKKY